MHPSRLAIGGGEETEAAHAFLASAYTPLGNAALLRRHGISATELDWWESDGPVSAVPSQHFSARGISDRNRNLWSGFVIASQAGNVYFAGAYGPASVDFIGNGDRSSSDPTQDRKFTSLSAPANLD